MSRSNKRHILSLKTGPSECIAAFCSYQILRLSSIKKCPEMLKLELCAGLVNKIFYDE